MCQVMWLPTIGFYPLLKHLSSYFRLKPMLGFFVMGNVLCFGLMWVKMVQINPCVLKN
jgi:hypothetical protein